MPTALSIDSVAGQSLALVEDDSLRHALATAYKSPQGLRAVETAHRVFILLTSSKWPVETVCQFLSGWHLTHGTALFVSGMMIRILRKAREVGEPARSLLHQAAGEIGEIILEDTGVDGTPHNDLFVEFANDLIGDDRWQLNRYAPPACQRFRSYVKKQRLNAPIEEAILTTAASENWNTGEYTYFNALLRPWMTDVLGHSADVIEEKVAYVSVHAGKTELGHFLHALNAWKLYCRATGLHANPRTAQHVLQRYLNEIGIAFHELERVLSGSTESSVRKWHA